MEHDPDIEKFGKWLGLAVIGFGLFLGMLVVTSLVVKALWF